MMSTFALFVKAQIHYQHLLLIHSISCKQLQLYANDTVSAQINVIILVVAVPHFAVGGAFNAFWAMVIISFCCLWFYCGEILQKRGYKLQETIYELILY